MQVNAAARGALARRHAEWRSRDGEAIHYAGVSPDRTFLCHLSRPVMRLSHNRSNTMDKDRVIGAAKQAKGSVKKALGKLTGDAKTEADGKAEQAEGRVQNAVGGAKDAVREAADKLSGRK
jgi:uncharacterized protein YjbJ (UPF0337 family)